MKLPLWAWNEVDKKWQRFPYELLKTYSDGKRGFDAECFCSECVRNQPSRKPLAEILRAHYSRFVQEQARNDFTPSSIQGSRWVYREDIKP